MAIDGFSRRAEVVAYLVAACSLAYAVVYLGFASRNPDDRLSNGWNARATAALPRRLAWLAIVDGLDQVLLYAATVAGASTVILVSGGLASVVLGPAFWIWSGRLLRA